MTFFLDRPDFNAIWDYPLCFLGLDWHAIAEFKILCQIFKNKWDWILKNICSTNCERVQPVMLHDFWPLLVAESLVISQEIPANDAETTHTSTESTVLTTSAKISKF